MSNKPLISIVGLTATGKTSLALQLGKQLLDRYHLPGIDIISADSRQVYQGLEILTGADLPEGFMRSSAVQRKFGYDYFSQGKINIHGVAIIEPGDSWSLAEFQAFALELIESAWTGGRLPILVGGTGLYHLGLFNPELAAHPGENSQVRTQAEQLSLSQVQDWLKRLDLNVWRSLSKSDQGNKRRLVRKIELAVAPQPAVDPGVKIHPPTQHPACRQAGLVIGLSDSLDQLKESIIRRVNQRFEQGAINEVMALKARYGQRRLPAWTAIGIREMSAYLNHELSAEDCTRLWSLREFQYAKRQVTWWKKRASVNWLLAVHPQLLDQATKLIDAQLTLGHN